MSFHENKLWQDAFVTLMDTHEAFEGEFEDAQKEIVEQVLESATDLSAKIADGLSRLDRRFGRQILLDAVGMVAIVRTHLAVAWGRGILTDETFKTLDGKFDQLSIALQGYR
jgi:four helix bundle protein